MVWTPLKNINQLGWLFPIFLGKFKKWQPNHQPATVLIVVSMFLFCISLVDAHCPWGSAGDLAINRELAPDAFGTFRLFSGLDCCLKNGISKITPQFPNNVGKTISPRFGGWFKLLVHPHWQNGVGSKESALVVIPELFNPHNRPLDPQFYTPHCKDRSMRGCFIHFKRLIVSHLHIYIYIHCWFVSSI